MITKGLLAATALVSLPSLAQAAVVISDVSILVPNTTAGVYINLVTGLTAATPGAVPGWDINPWGTSTLNFWANNPASPSSGIVVTGPGGRPVDLAAGTIIDASSFFARTPGNATEFLTGGNHIFGFSFFNESTSMLNYGYARITTTASSNGRPATISQLVYENTGAALRVGSVAGAVPEPATWAMMLLGFGAIGFSMRGRAKVSKMVRIA